MSHRSFIVEIHGTLEIVNPSVLDLSRGESIFGSSFASESALLEYLAIRVIGYDLALAQLDGWADLPAGSVVVHRDYIEAESL